MKIFRGMPGGQVTVEDGGKVTVLPSINAKMGFAWGAGGAEASHLSLALAESVLGDHEEAVRFYQRLKHRTVMSWTKSSQWSISEKDLLSHIEDMRQNERESSQAKAMVSQQPVPVVYEGGTGIGGIPIKRSQQDGGPGPEVSPERRAAVVDTPINMRGPDYRTQRETPPQPSMERGEAIPDIAMKLGPPKVVAVIVPDDWPEKVDGFRATAGDFVTGTRLVYCLVLCGCYSWQDAAQVPEERLRAIPLWGDALMAEMMEALRKRNITYVVKERRQQLLAAALAKLTPEEKEAMGLS
jgi:hypothetical protein